MECRVLLQSPVHLLVFPSPSLPSFSLSLSPLSLSLCPPQTSIPLFTWSKPLNPPKHPSLHPPPILLLFLGIYRSACLSIYLSIYLYSVGLLSFSLLSLSLSLIEELWL